MGLVKRLWRGEVSLARTYWVYGVAVNIFIQSSVLLLSVLVESMPVLAFSLLGMIAFSLVYMVFISVAIWRSSNRYQGNRAWAFLAKAAVVLGYARLVVDFAI